MATTTLVFPATPDLSSVIPVSAGLGGVLLVLVLVVASVIFYVRRKTRATFIVARDLTLNGVHNRCHEIDIAATKETDLDQSIYASISDLHKPSEGCCSYPSNSESIPRRARALSNQYFEASISPLLCHNTANDEHGTYLSLTAIHEEPLPSAPPPPPRLDFLPNAATTSEQLRYSLSSPDIAPKTVPTDEPRCSTPLPLVAAPNLYAQVNKSGRKTSASLPADLCTATAGPSVKQDSTEDVYIEMVGESVA